MDIDRRAFLASVGGLAVVEALDDEAKAEALEHYMMDVLDGHVGHRRLSGQQVVHEGRGQRLTPVVVHDVLQQR